MITNYELIDSKETQYLIFDKYKFKDKVTYNIEISNKDETFIGEIKWYSGWRRYVFNSRNSAIFDSSCLKEITKYIDDLMEERKNGN